MCDPHTPSARMTSGGPCARRVRHGEPLHHLSTSTEQLPDPHAAVGVAHVRPAYSQRPDDQRRALCPEGAPWRAPTPFVNVNRTTAGSACSRRGRTRATRRATSTRMTSGVIGRVTSVDVGCPVSSIRRVRRRGCARGTTKQPTAMAAKAPRLQTSRLGQGARHR